MLKFNQNSYIDVDAYHRRLSSVPFIVLDIDRMSTIRTYNLNVQNTLYRSVEACMAANSGNKYASLTKSNIYSYLVNIEGVPDSRIGYTPGGDISLDVNKYLKPLYEDGYAEEFFELYLRYIRIKKYNGDMGSVISDCYIPIDDEHRNLKKCTFNVQQRDNLRFFYNNVNIVNIPSMYNECILPPPGYVLVAGDFAQSDFRIAYNLLLRDENNAKIMDSIEDKYEGMARILAEAFNEPFDLDKFKAERNIMKVNILGPMYGKSHANSKKSKEFVNRMNKFLDLCPRYQEFKTSIEERYQLGLPISVESYFGNTMPIMVKPGKKGHTDTVNKALNTPIQTGTSEIMILLVNSILDKFAELGYKEGEDFSIYYSRHDEPLFIIKEELMKESWVFKNASEIIVDNWTPLHLDFTFHRRYKVPCEELQEAYKRSIIMNADKIETVEPSEPAKPHKMIKGMETYAVYLDKVDTKTVACIYDSKNNRVIFKLYDDTNTFNVWSSVRQEVLNLAPSIFRAQSNVALVYNTYQDLDNFYGGVLFKFNKHENNKVIAVARVLCENMCARYALKYNLKYTPTVPLQEYKDLIKSVKDWDEK